jgi:hypothetical protein
MFFPLPPQGLIVEAFDFFKPLRDAESNDILPFLVAFLHPTYHKKYIYLIWYVNHGFAVFSATKEAMQQNANENLVTRSVRANSGVTWLGR